MELESLEKQLKESDFIDLEVIIDTKLPCEFINHYLKYNGGYPTEKEAEENPTPLHGFNSIKYGKLTIEQLIKDYEKQDYFFGKKIPFAFDAGDNHFILSLEDGDTYGKVYFLPHEWEIIDGEYVMANDFEFVTNSFTEFLEKYALWL